MKPETSNVQASDLSISAGSRLSSYRIGKAVDLSELEQLESEVQNSGDVATDLVSSGSTKFISCENMENVGAAHELPGVPGSKIRDEFRGDDELLKRCIVSLISLNDSGSLAPHGIGGHARSLLSAAYHRL